MTGISLDGVRLFSLDAFDTLILRSVPEPEAVHAIVGERAVAAGHLPRHATPSWFATVRRAAEERARHDKRRRTGTTEVHLDEIYAAWPGPIDGSALASLELAVESSVVFAHPGTVALVREARRRRIPTALVSDTYFRREDLSRLLVAAGLRPDLFDVILTSADAGCSKRDGGLFRVLHSHYPDVAPTDVLHVGDHAYADVARARRAGFQAVPHDTGLSGPAGEALRLERVRYGHALPELASLRALAATGATTGTDDDRSYFALGAAVLGPTLSAFADWVVDEAAHDGITTLRPLMREGALLERLLRRAADAADVSLDIAPIFVSRSATWLASLEAFDDRAIRTLLQRQHLTVSEVLRTLGLEGHPAVESLLPFGQVTLGSESETTTAPGHTVGDLVATTLARADVRRHVTQVAVEAKALASAYLAETCPIGPRVGLVDIGFRASIGQALERIAPRARFSHFLLFAADRVARLWAAGMDVRAFAGGPIDNADLVAPIARHPAVLEVLLIEGGTTLGYERTAHGVAPIVAACQAPAAQVRATAACRAGIEHFQSLWLEWKRHRPSAGQPIAARREFAKPVHRLVTMPSQEEAWRLGGFVHEANEGGRSESPLVDVTAMPEDIGPDDFRRATASGGRAFGHAWPWPAAAAESRWPGHHEDRWRDISGAVDGAPPVLPAVARRMKQRGIAECVVWGAGEAGSALIRAIRREGIVVKLATDSNPEHWGTELDGVPVVAPTDACQSGTATFAIGSFAFAQEIERSLRGQFAGRQDALTVFSPLSERAA